MIQTRRFLLGAAAVAVCALVASACDTSPVAISVNSQQIKQTAVNAELRAYADNPAFVKAYDAQQASGSGAAPSVAGSGAGTYSAAFVAGVLNSKVVAAALHQYLVAHHNLPGAGQIAAARGWESALEGAYWLGFPPAFRDELAVDFAEQSQFVTVSTSNSALRGAIKEGAVYLYSQVCVRQVGFSANQADGEPDYAASLAAAHKALATGSLLAGGAVSCYSPVQLEGQGQTFYNLVLKTAVGHSTAPQKTSFGYQVYAVTRRTALPYDAAMKRVTSMVAAEESGKATSSLQEKILVGAKIHLNPQYGTWDPQTGVTPATGPKASGS